MARINLLPWREELRKERNKNFGIAMGVAGAVAAAAVAGVYFYVESLLEHQQMRNRKIQGEIKVLESKIAEIKDIEQRKRGLLSRMNVIQELQSHRPVVVHLFDEMVRTLPEGVVLQTMTQSGDSISLSGLAQSNERISTYMRNLNKSEWLGGAVLEVIQNASDGRHTFTLRVKQTWKGKEEEDNG
jgi:type IV pilus assembly protein PilN